MTTIASSTARHVDVDIRPLTPASSADYFAFFDGDAFADNPRWASCYCHFLWAPADVKPWNGWTGAENRAAVTDLIAARELQGYLAYAGGKPVGWCNATPKVKIPALREERDPDAAAVGAIACFAIVREDGDGGAVVRKTFARR